MQFFKGCQGQVKVKKKFRFKNKLAGLDTDSHNQDGKLHIEYVMDRGPDDVPLDAVRECLAPVLKREGKSKILGNDF